MLDFLSEIDWNAVFLFGLLVVNAVSAYYLYGSVPKDTFDRLAGYGDDVTDAIPGEIDDAVFNAIVAALRSVLVKDEDETPDV